MDSVEAGSPRTAEGLARGYLGRVFNYCLSFLRDAQDAEDACQETFLAVARHESDLQAVRVPEAWLMEDGKYKLVSNK